MDDERLSDDEMAALLDLIDGQRSGEDAAPSAPTGRARDERLRLACVEAARAVGRTLGSALRGEVRAELLRFEAARLGTHLERLPDPCLVYPLGPLEQPLALLELDVPLVHAMFERLLGGRPGETPNTARPNATVLQLVRSAVVDVARCLVEDLEPWLRQPPPDDATSGTACLSPAPFADLEPQAPLLVAEIGLQGELGGALRLVLFEDALKPGRATRGSERPAETTQRAISAMPVEVRAVLGRARLTLRDLVDLEVGDVLRLPTAADEPLAVEIQGEPRFHGRLGRRHGRIALTLEGTSAPPERKPPTR